MLLHGAHLAEGADMPVRPEDGIVAEACRPARGENKLAVDAALEGLGPSVGPGEGEDAVEMSPPGPRRASGAQLLFDARHRRPEVLGVACPARGIDAGSIAERLDAESRVVGKRGRRRSSRRRLGLQLGVVAEGETGLLGLDEAQLRRADGPNAVGLQELAEFPQLAGVTPRRFVPTGDEARRRSERQNSFGHDLVALARDERNAALEAVEDEELIERLRQERHSRSH